jgi:hypothetical protein
MGCHAEQSEVSGFVFSEKMGCHAERSEASAFIFLKTNNCRFLAALRMTAIVHFLTASMQGGVELSLEM